MCMFISNSYRTVSRPTWQIFYEFLISCKFIPSLEGSEIKLKYEKRVKHLSYCTRKSFGNYFIGTTETARLSYFYRHAATLC